MKVFLAQAALMASLVSPAQTLPKPEVITTVPSCPIGHYLNTNRECVYAGFLSPTRRGIEIIDGEGDLVGTCHHAVRITDCKPARHHTKDEMMTVFSLISKRDLKEMETIR